MIINQSIKTLQRTTASTLEAWVEWRQFGVKWSASGNSFLRCIENRRHSSDATIQILDLFSLFFIFFVSFLSHRFYHFVQFCFYFSFFFRFFDSLGDFVTLFIDLSINLYIFLFHLNEYRNIWSDCAWSIQKCV